MDQKINDFGIYIDVNFAKAAIAISKGVFDLHPEEVSKLTDGFVKTPNQVAKILDWLNTQGCHLDNMKKGSVADALSRGDLSPKTKKILEIRRDGSLKGSLKYEKILKQISEDGRVHGSLIFHGAHTGRWASYSVQVHNFKKPPKVGMTKAVEAVSSGDINTVSSLYNRPIRIICDTARAVIYAGTQPTPRMTNALTGLKPKRSRLRMRSLSKEA